jgi:tetratricopeptide (TPR) repeat protein
MTGSTKGVLRTRHAGRLLLALLSTGVPAFAAAQPAAPAQADEGARRDTEQSERAYRDLIERALREFQAGNWPEALGLFKRAHASSPSARTLRGMGLTAYEMRDYVQAIHQLQAALEDARRPLTEAQRQQAEQVIRDAKGFVSTYRVALDPPGATLHVDGREVELDSSRTLLLNSGVHEILVAAEGHEEQRRTLRAEPGAAEELRIHLRPLHPVAEAPAAPGPTAATSASRSTGWTWVAVGAAGAFAASGVAFHLLAGSAYDDVKEVCPRGTCTAGEVRAAIDDGSGKTYDALSAASFALSGAAAVTAVVLLLSAESGEAERLDVRIGPGHAAIRGRF